MLVLAPNNSIIENHNLKPAVGMRVSIKSRGHIAVETGVIKSVYADGRCRVTIPIKAIRHADGRLEVLETMDKVYSSKSLVVHP